MIKISGPKIQEVVSLINEKEIDEILYSQIGEISGIQAFFNINSLNEEKAKEGVKKFLKTNMRYYTYYVEIV